MNETDLLISVQEALERILETIPTLGSQRVGLDESLGRILGENVAAPHSLPPFDNSSMDGFAVKAADIAQAAEDAPVVLKVIGEAKAGGEEPSEIDSGEAMRIMTGAPLPPGSDVVVPVELTTEPEAMVGKTLPESVSVRAPVAEGDYIRRAGLDVVEGEQVLDAGSLIGPPEIGMLAALGIASPKVRRIPKVAVLSTGDELLDIDKPLSPGLIRDANGSSLAASVRRAGGDPYRLPIAGDQEDEIRARFEAAVNENVDMIISSAGVSMGAHDYVRIVLEQEGSLAFWKINMRPGKPLAYGSYKDVPFIALPGNPVSALVTFQVFVVPILARFLGRGDDLARTRVWASLAEPIRSEGRESYLRAILSEDDGGFQVRLTGTQDSAVLSSLVHANCLVIVPSGVRELGVGERMETWLLGEIQQDSH